MKKTILSLFVILLTICLAVNVIADSYSTKGTVTFNGTALKTDFKAADITKQANAMQPGDDLTITITLKNDHSAETDWYMYNIARGFEDISSNGGIKDGAYTYTLKYDGPNQSRTIYSSSTVGGKDSDSLQTGTASLKDYFFLGSLKQNETGKVTLSIKMDGATHTNDPENDYSNAKMDLTMRFAVELTNNKDVVKTGDDTQIMPYVIAAAVSGVLHLFIAVLRLKKSRRDRGQGKA